MANKDAFDEEDAKRIDEEYKSLISDLKRCDRPGDKELIEKAFALANESHWNMRRKSGEPYIIHPISVAKIANQEIGLGAKSIAAALLHDVVEDTEHTLSDIEKEFGQKIASIIDGLTKISGTHEKETSDSMQAENFKRMLLTISDDLRVILIKIADRLHNMRTLDAMPEHKRMKIAGETIFLYAPLAYQMGLFLIKSELEDLSLKFRQPKVYNEIFAKIKDSEKQTASLIDKFSLPIVEKLTEEGFEFDISGRHKSVFSIWNKMKNKNVPFEEIYDIFAVRIIFEPLQNKTERAQCWKIYRIITDLYESRPDRLRDWVGRPKPNGYEGLHLTVMGPEGKWIEVQIRSKRMDEIAERGHAAHWKYKGNDGSPENELDKWIERISDILKNPLEDPVEFLDDFNTTIYLTEITVYTPKGSLISLPKGSSALDFAYEIHTDIGNKAMGAKINYKLCSIDTILNSGDQVEIITSDIAKPDKEWLNYVHTTKARGAIRSALKIYSKDIIQKGSEILQSQLLKSELTGKTIKSLCTIFGMADKNELLTNIGLGNIKPDEIKKSFKKQSSTSVIKYWNLKPIDSEKDKKNQPIVIGKKTPFLLSEKAGNASQSYTISKCCNPIPGDEVMGYHSQNGSIIIHKSHCPEAIRLMSNEGNNIIAVKWAIHRLNSFKARIQMNGIDRLGLVNKITKTISSELKINISGINISVDNGIFEGTMDLYVHNTKDLNNLIMKISNIDGMENVKRVEDYSA